MIKKILKHWKKGSHIQHKTCKEANVVFSIQYKTLEIGRLELKDGLWVFYYTEKFKQETQARTTTIDKLVNFPDLDKVYQSESLWPFFNIRIPGLGQPKIQKLIQQENIDPTDEVSLLKKFGEATIANPFRLIALT